MIKISNFKTLDIRNLNIVWSLLLGAWNFHFLGQLGQLEIRIIGHFLKEGF
jgi:hypothetical protein